MTNLTFINGLAYILNDERTDKQPLVNGLAHPKKAGYEETQDQVEWSVSIS